MRQVALQDPLLQQLAELVWIRSHRLNHGVRVGVDSRRLARYPCAEFQLLHHAGAGRQAHHRFQLVVAEEREFDGQAQLQRLPLLVEAHQHPAADVLEAENLIFGPLE